MLIELNSNYFFVSMEHRHLLFQDFLKVLLIHASIHHERSFPMRFCHVINCAYVCSVFTAHSPVANRPFFLCSTWVSKQNSNSVESVICSIITRTNYLKISLSEKEMHNFHRCACPMDSVLEKIGRNFSKSQRQKEKYFRRTYLLLSSVNFMIIIANVIVYSLTVDMQANGMFSWSRADTSGIMLWLHHNICIHKQQVFMLLTTSRMQFGNFLLLI